MISQPKACSVIELGNSISKEESLISHDIAGIHRIPDLLRRYTRPAQMPTKQTSCASMAIRP